MNHLPKNPFKNLKLDKEEKEIEEAFENSNIQELKVTPQQRKSLQNSAKATLEKIKNINIRLTELDLYNLKIKAMEEGIPYQTLIGSIIHKYTSGILKPI